MDIPSTSGDYNNSTKKSRIDSCFVPLCPSTSTKFPNKLFLTGPSDPKLRKKWFQAARRTDKYSPKTIIRCCEDHFDLENDVENWMKFKMFGGKLFLKKDVVPHIFECQNRMMPPKPRSVLMKRKRSEILDSIENTPDPSSECSLNTETPDSQNIEICPISNDKSVQMAIYPYKRSSRLQVWSGNSEKPVKKRISGTDNESEDSESEEIDDSEIPHIIQISPFDGTCIHCKTEQPCTYRYTTKDNETAYLCSEACANNFQRKGPGQYFRTHKKYLIKEIVPKVLTCTECEEIKTCYFYYNYDGEDTNYCSMACLNSMMADEADKYMFMRQIIVVVKEVVPKEGECCVCNVHKSCSYSLTRYGEALLICEKACIKTLNAKESGRYMIRRNKITKHIVEPCILPEENVRYITISKATRKQTIVPRIVPEENARYVIKKGITPRKQPTKSQNPPLLNLKVICNATDKYLDKAYKIGRIDRRKTPAMVQAVMEKRERILQAAKEERERTFIRTCHKCQIILNLGEKLLTWETMDFCGELCLGRYLNKIGARCANCKNNVQHTSLGKYCVRFGFKIRQFCNNACLEEFKKGLKMCHYCQKDISVGHQSFLAPVGDKRQLKDFCSQACVEKFDLMSKNPIPQPVWAKCAVCSLEKANSIEVEVSEELSQRLCSDACFTAFKFVNNIVPDQCRWCKKYFERKQSKCFTIYEGSNTHCFCSKSCMNVRCVGVRSAEG
ncbi:uncharacterized protein LOC118264429 isoform X1 [Spodoptera frugiperda]|uniref:Uncharacterized protein LOC118264429 isoform X1 n=1 Tax=Spodoptera frugiperda TaxID=7108 RepID=A0A9R0E058_SPOFR|nr:uncharacterized protein LOC118264429 isoform X1 [Spodoptera frugiperda]